MLYLFNTTIMPNQGVFVNRKITQEQASEIIRRNSDDPTGMVNYVSALGHQGSADAFNSVFPQLHCEVNRVQAQMAPGDQALCLKVTGRLPEGSILTLAELTELGFEFFLITNIGATFEDGSIYNSHLGFLSPEINYVHGNRRF